MKKQVKDIFKVALPIAMLLSSSWNATSSNFNVETSEKEDISENASKEFVIKESNVDDSVILTSSWNCGYACSSACGSSCSNGCSTSCIGSCKGNCSMSCDNSCRGNCFTGCYNSCYSSSR